MKKQIIFHIGMEKTGTTSLQRFCHDNRRLLLAHDILYPTTRLAYSSWRRNHLPLVAAYLRERGNNDLDFKPFPGVRSQVVAALLHEMERSPAQIVMISAEHLSSQFTDRDIENLAEDFSQFDCQIAATVRRHDLFVYAAYKTAVRAGAPFTIDEYFQYLSLPSVRYTRFAEIAAAWSRVFGKHALRLFVYENHQDMIGPILRLAAPEFSPFVAPRLNRSSDFNPTSLLMVRRLNRDIFESGDFDSDLMTSALIWVARWRLNAAAAKLTPETDRDVRASPETLARFKEIAELDRISLRDNFGADLPEIPVFEENIASDALERAARDFLTKTKIAHSLPLRAARQWSRLRRRHGWGS
ncbi:MAG: hypothetical protein KDJ25_00755 [Rhodoblastus sp.]|nr:hypothetical protein [Rhodoblastus sp.]